MCFGFKVSLFHGEGFDHFSSVFDDGVVLFSAVGMIGFVLFRGVHYNFTRNILSSSLETGLIPIIFITLCTIFLSRFYSSLFRQKKLKNLTVKSIAVEL